MFRSAAEETSREVRTLFGLLVHTGYRFSEALWLTADRVDLRADLAVFETLKKCRSALAFFLQMGRVVKRAG